MGCNSKNCNTYSPLGDPDTYGVYMEKVQKPYPNTKRINAPTWDRDRVMYDFEDVCSAIVPSSRYSTDSTYSETTTTDPQTGQTSTTSTLTPGYGFLSINRWGENSGKLNEVISGTSWWDLYKDCATIPTVGQYSGGVQKVRYWDNYPSELSFEPIFSDTWFYYLFDTRNGVTGTPCHTYCFIVTYYNSEGSQGGSGSTQPRVNWVYSVVKRPYECPCYPDETYIKYTLEDGMTNPAYNEDPYPTFWAVGTRRNAIAFKYNVNAGNRILKYQPKESSEKYPLWRNNAATGERVWTKYGVKMFGKVGASNAKEDGFETTQDVTFSNGMVLNMTFTCHRGAYGNLPIGGNANTFVKINSVVSAPSGGWPSTRTKVPVRPRTATDNSLITNNIMGHIWIIPPGGTDNPDDGIAGVPVDFMLNESKYIGGVYAVSGGPGWSSWFNQYAIWTNNVQENLVGREMTISNRKIPVATTGTYTLEIGIDNAGSVTLDTWGRTAQEDEDVLADADEGRIISVTGGFTGSFVTTTFSVVKTGFINLVVDIENQGTDINWATNPGGYAIVLRNPSGNIVWTTRDAVNGQNAGDAFRGMKLSDAGWVDAWDGSTGIPFRSTKGQCWNANNVVVYKDYKFPGGLKLRMKLQSEWDDDNDRYNTIWRIHKILKYGSDYQDGNGVDFIDQQKFTMWFPDKQDPNRISLSLLISQVDNQSQIIPQSISKIGENMSVNGWSIRDVRHSNDELNMHFAEISGGTTNFVKDGVYTVSNGASITVKAGKGITDRAVLIGLYEFRKKEIEFGVGVPTEGIPFSPDIIRPRVSAQIENGRVTGVQIIGRGKGLQNKNIETPKLVVEPPPTYFNHDLYNKLLEKGVGVQKAKNKCKGTGKIAQLRPTFSKGRLVSVEVLDGGSGYSTTNPPNVFVPYIARTDQIVAQEKQDMNAVEFSNKQLFEKSPIFQNFAKQTWKAPTYEIDSNGNAKITGSKQQAGFKWSDYQKLQTDVHKEITFPLTKPDVATMTTGNSKWQTKFELKGIDKKFAQSFKTGKSTDTNTNVKQVKSKTSDNYKPGKYAQNLGVDDEKLKLSDYNVKLPSGNFPKVSGVSKLDYIGDDEKLSAKTNNPQSNSQVDSYGKSIGSVKASSPKVPSKKDGNIAYTKDFLKFTEGMANGGNVTTPQWSKLEWSKTAGKQSIPQDKIFPKYNNPKIIAETLASQEASMDASFDEMWERDESTNRIGSWYNTEMRVVKQSFFNLPCRSNKEIYLMRRFCPDPRPWTHITLRLGVIKNPVDPADPDKTHCKKCLEDQPALVTIRNQIRSQFNDNSLDIEDAYCVSLYGLPYFGWYGGLGAGVGANGTSYAVPFGENGYTGGIWYTQPGSLKALTGYQKDDTRLEDGCRSYEVGGRLQIYHSLTNETNTWADAVSSYGNPYDFMCEREYGDSGEEDLYSTEDATNSENSDAGIMPGNYTTTINGQQYDTGISQTVPEEGY